MVRRSFLSCAVIVLLAVCGPLPASEDDLRPQLLQDELYTEGWDYYFLFDDGTWVTVQTFISNFGPGNHRGLVIGTITKADDESIVIKNGRPREKWQFSESGYDFKLARHHLMGEFPDYRLRLRNRRGELEIDLTATAPPWRPMTGQVSEERHYVSMFLTQLRAEGRYRSGGDGDAEAPWRRLQGGVGYAVRYLNAKSLSKVASGWLRLAPWQAEGDDKPLLLLLTQPDGQQTNHMALLTGDVIRWQGSGFSVSYEEAVSMVPNGHLIPQTISLDVEHGGTSISGTVRVRQLLQRFDFVGELKNLERIFVRFINTPIHYRYLADYDFQVRDSGGVRRLTGSGFAEYMTLKYQ